MALIKKKTWPWSGSSQYQALFGQHMDRFAWEVSPSKGLPETVTWSPYPEGVVVSCGRGKSERGLPCLDDDRMENLCQPQDGESLGHWAPKSSSGMRYVIAPGFALLMSNRYWKRFHGVGKASRLQMAKNMLIWAMFKTTECLRILNLELASFWANGPNMQKYT